MPALSKAPVKLLARGLEGVYFPAATTDGSGTLRLMAISKQELIATLQNEVRILLHLISKVEPEQLDYRPTPGQRSTIELIRYLAFMAPQLTNALIKESFDREAWAAAAEVAAQQDLGQLTKAIEAQSAMFDELLSPLAEEDFAKVVPLFGRSGSKGEMLNSFVVCGFAAYRMQLFLYLKANGRSELSTMNLWSGMDPAPKDPA